MLDQERYEVVLIEFAGRDPFSIAARDSRGIVCTFDVDRSQIAGGLWRHMSGCGGPPYLEHQGALRWWAARGVNPKDTLQGKNRMKRPPRGRFSPARILSEVRDADAEGGDWCDECGDFIPSTFEPQHQHHDDDE